MPVTSQQTVVLFQKSFNKISKNLSLSVQRFLHIQIVLNEIWTQLFYIAINVEQKLENDNKGHTLFWYKTLVTLAEH